MRIQQNPLPVPWLASPDQPRRPLLWTAKLAGWAVLAVPVLVLAAAALLVGLFVFRALSTILGLLTLPLRVLGSVGARGMDSGRRNVRVIERDRPDGEM